MHKTSINFMLAATAVVIAGGMLAYLAFTSVKNVADNIDPQTQITSPLAAIEETEQTNAVEKKPQPIYVNPNEPEKIYITIPPTQPSIEVNGTKNENSPTTNNYYATPPAASTQAPAFVEPAPMTNLEIALDIVKLYDPNGTAQYWGDGENRIKVTAFGGKSVTIDVTSGWEENLKLTLRKIK